MDSLAEHLKAPLIDLLLSVADDKLILGHRNADWTGLAPILEEDIAFSALAQDDIAHATALYELIACIEGCGTRGERGAARTSSQSDALVGDGAQREARAGSKDEIRRRADQLAYGREPGEYRCAAIVELHDEFDWSIAIVRQFLCDHFDHLRLMRLAASAFTPLRELSVRLLAEERLAIGHADQWIVRLGRGGDESRARIQAALDRLAPLACELFEPTEGVERLEAAGAYPKPSGGNTFTLWEDAVENVVEEATLHVRLAPPQAGFRGGRRGVHSPEFVELLAEMTEVYRVEPEAAW